MISIILICFVWICISLFLRHNAKPKIYNLEPVSTSNDKFQEKLQNSLVNEINSLGIPGIQVSIINKEKEYDLSIGTIDFNRKLKITNENIKDSTITMVW